MPSQQVHAITNENRGCTRGRSSPFADRSVARLRVGDFQPDESKLVLRFSEEAGKCREIPVRHDLDGHIRMDLDSAGIAAEN